MDTIFELKGYKTSRDYERLANTMQYQSVVCIVDYGADCRDVAHTLWSPTRDGKGTWQISGRGIGYIYGFDRNDFVRQCEKLNVEIIFPTLRPDHTTLEKKHTTLRDGQSEKTFGTPPETDATRIVAKKKDRK